MDITLKNTTANSKSQKLNITDNRAIFPVQQKDVMRLPKNACSNNDFLFRRRRIFEKSVYVHFSSAYQVMFTSFFGLDLPLFTLFVAV